MLDYWTLLQPRTRLLAAIILMIGLILYIAAINLRYGEPDLSFMQLWQTLWVEVKEGEDDLAQFILFEVRFPRVLMSLLAGAALGLAGVMLQGSLRNPLADPSLLGIAQGASFVVAMSIIYPEWLPDWPLPILCLIAGLFTGAVVLITCGSIRSTIRIILAGAIISGFFATLSSALILLAPYDRISGAIGSYLRFTAGSFSSAYWDDIYTTLPWLAVGMPAAWFCARSLNLLQLGDEMATGAGLNPRKARFFMILVALVLISPVIATVGPIGFIALFSPHLSRAFIKTGNAFYLMLVSSLAGSLLIVAADVVGRLWLYPIEVPAGVWAIILIGPVAILLLSRKLKRV